MNHSLADAGGVRLLCLGAALLLGLCASCSEKQPPANIPTTIDGNDPRPHLVTIAFQNRGEGPTTAHYTYNGREMGTYSEGLRNVVRELEAAPEPYVLILHEPGYSIADAGGNVDGLNVRFAQALVGKRVVKFGLDTDVEVLVVYIGLTNDHGGIFELNGQRATERGVFNALGQQRSKNGMVFAVEQGRYRSPKWEETRDVSKVCGVLEDYQHGYPGFVLWLSLQDSTEWKSE